MPKFRTLGALLILAATALPAFAQSMIDKPLPSLAPASGGSVLLAPSDVPPIDDADTHRAWQEMSREWEARQRSYGATAAQPPVYAPRNVEPPRSPQERAETRRDWEEMSREWEARQRGMIAGTTVR